MIEPTTDPQPRPSAFGITLIDASDLPDAFQTVHGPAGPTPVRPARSIRRTSSIDMGWNGGWSSPLELAGRARDAVTIDFGTSPISVATASTEVVIGQNRTIDSIDVEPARDTVGQLVGERGGGHLRSVLDDVLPGEREAGTPLYLLLDDISGTSLIAGFALMRRPDLLPPISERPERPSMEGVCIGFAPGSSALNEPGVEPRPNRTQAVPSVVNPDDREGWHEFAESSEVSMRRVRRIDVWRNEAAGEIIIDSAFQDSAREPDGSRVAIHEYLLRATADATTLELLSVEADPRVLPFRECPSAVATAQRLVGTRLPELRAAVLEHLGRTSGCTHLNDALRALAEVPVLVAQLDETIAAANHG